MDESERLVAPSLSTLAFERLENAIMQGAIMELNNASNLKTLFETLKAA
ncbi:hypothetical protein OAB19_06795 [Planktomarina temperata]|nr:hypothetical protein [Planktomarina temperata]